MKWKTAKSKFCPHALVAIVLLAGFTGSLWFLQTRALRLVQPIRVTPQTTPADLGITVWQEVTFVASDGVWLSGWFISPSSASNGKTLIFIHGLGSNRGALLRQASLLHEQGYGALLFDLRAHGESGGERTSWGVNEVADVAGAIAFLQAQTSVNPDCLALIGHSMGGAIAIHAANQMPTTVQALVVESSYASLAANGERLTVSFARLPEYFAPLVMPWAAWLARVDVTRIRPVDEVRQIAPRPILFIHGAEDKTIEMVNSQQLYEAAADPKSLLILSGAGHDTLLEEHAPVVAQQLMQFLGANFCPP